LNEIYHELFSQPFPSKEQLAEFALKGHGYCMDNGYFGVTYPNDLDEYEREIEGQFIPQGMIRINYWDGSDKEVMVVEKDYLIALKNHLLRNGDEDLARYVTTTLCNLEKSMEVVVIEAHISEYPTPLFLKRGDIVTLGAMDDEFPNWVFITNDAGEQAWSPIQYIDNAIGSSKGILVQDYDNLEFNTVIGEKLSVLFELNSWYRVSRSTDEIGWVPVHTVKRI